jgi:uncharacterized membrane protein YraQ (UPF0718 family)
MTEAIAGLKRASRHFWRIDRVILASIAVLLVVAQADPAQLPESLRFTLQSLLGIAPFLAISVAFAAGAKATGLDRQIARIFAARGTSAIILAAAFGALSPFCSCGVIPIIAGLLGAGVPLPPVMAFWLASPLMDPEMFILMLPVYPLHFILTKVLAAFALGLFGGWTVRFLLRWPAFEAPLKRAPSGCASGVMKDSPVVWRFWEQPSRRQSFLTESRSIGWFLFKWLTLAFLVESLMVAYLPADGLASLVGDSPMWAVPTAAAVGIPAYLNGYAAIPTVSALIELGLPAGAGLAFMLAGGVTSIPAAMGVYALVRWQVLLVYLLLGAIGAVAAGLAYQAVLLAV